jgi:hypothetical protein
MRFFSTIAASLAALLFLNGAVELLSKVVFELKSSGNPDFRNHLDSIRELYTFNHLCQVIKAT